MEIIRTPATTSELDDATFAARYSSLLLRAGDATQAHDDTEFSFCCDELAQLQADNPVRTVELQTRWEATDADL